MRSFFKNAKLFQQNLQENILRQQNFSVPTPYDFFFFIETSRFARCFRVFSFRKYA